MSLRVEEKAMIGGMIENLKNPKNVLGTLIAGYVGVFIGYVWTVYIGRWEWLGQIIGFLGVLTMLFTLLRLGLTRIIYGIIIGVLLVVYFGWYMNSTATKKQTHRDTREWEPWKADVRKRKRPIYAKSGIAQKFNEAAFAPAYMFDSTILRRGKWASKVGAERTDWTSPNK